MWLKLLGRLVVRHRAGQQFTAQCLRAGDSRASTPGEGLWGPFGQNVCLCAGQTGLCLYSASWTCLGITPCILPAAQPDSYAHPQLRDQGRGRSGTNDLLPEGPGQLPGICSTQEGKRESGRRSAPCQGGWGSGQALNPAVEWGLFRGARPCPRPNAPATQGRVPVQ